MNQLHLSRVVDRESGGMSDLYTCELEDNVWDDFGASNDHTVPHPGDECGEEFAVLGDSNKKPHVAIDVTSTAANATKYKIRGKEETVSPILTKKTHNVGKGCMVSNTR